MPLDELLETIETLRGRIEAHGNTLRTSEAQTRYALIDPLLRELGWDTSDPSLVVPEYSASGGRADYALLGENGKPAVMVEAKRLDRPLEDGLSQSIAYCVEQGTPHFCVSDGRRWAIYETFRQVAVHEKLVTQFDLVQDAPAEACLKALALWRMGAATGTVQVAERPVAPRTASASAPEAQRQSGDAPSVRRPLSRRTHAASPATKQVHTLSRQESSHEPRGTESEGAWIPLPAVMAGRFKSPPTHVRFANGTTVSLTRWGHVPEQITRRLNEAGQLTPRECPIPHGKKRYLVAAQPVHPTGKSFFNPKQVGALWLEANYSAEDHIRNARIIIEHAGLDPADFQVRLAD